MEQPQQSKRGRSGKPAWYRHHPSWDLSWLWDSRSPKLLHEGLSGLEIIGLQCLPKWLQRVREPGGDE